METVHSAYLLPRNTPDTFPGLAAFWRFDASGETFRAAEGAPYTLQSQVGSMEVVEDPTAPLGGKALRIQNGQWLNLARKECPLLDVHGADGHLTVVAYHRLVCQLFGCASRY